MSQNQQKQDRQKHAQEGNRTNETNTRKVQAQGREMDSDEIEETTGTPGRKQRTKIQSGNRK